MTTFRPLVFSLPNAIALQAMSHVLVRLCVLWAVFVALWAVRDFGPCNLERNDGGLIPKSAPKIFLQGDGLKMLWVDAAPNPAQMIKLQASRNGPAKQLVGNSVGLLALTVIVPKHSVTASVNYTQPKPAARIWFRNSFSQQSFERRHGVDYIAEAVL